MEENLGYDYGAKPRLMLVGNVEFPELLRRGFVALAYEQLSYFGLLVNPPLLGMVFADGGSARRCFEIFKGWSDASEDGDAVGVGFIESDDEYSMCIYQEQRRFIDRMVPQHLRGEVDPIVMTAVQSKGFPHRSRGLDWFKRSTHSRPFVLAPVKPTGEPILELAVRKREVNFYREGEVPENTPEWTLSRSGRDESEGEAHHPVPPEARPSPASIRERRAGQLTRFFPVTLERLAMDRGFRQTQAELAGDGYREWQIDQAACNIALRHRHPELFAVPPALGNDGAEDSPAIKVLEHLIFYGEDVSVALPTAGQLSAAALREQVRADALDLLQYTLYPDTPSVTYEGTQAELAERGLLDG